MNNTKIDIHTISHIIDKMKKDECFGEDYLAAINKLEGKSPRDVLRFLAEAVGNPKIVIRDNQASFQKLFFAACRSSSLFDIAEFAPQIFSANDRFFLASSHSFLQQYPSLSPMVKDLLSNIETNKNNIRLYSMALIEILSFEPLREVKKTFDKILKTPDSPLAKDILSKLGSLCPIFPKLKEYLFAKNEMIFATPEYYRNLQDFVKIMPDCDYVMQKFEKAIVSDINTPESLAKAFSSLENLSKELPPSAGDKILMIAKKGVKNPKNSRHSVRAGYRMLEYFDKLSSNIIWGKKVAKSKKNKYGWIPNSKIDFERPCVLCLCGDGVLDEKSANGYASSIYSLLCRNNMENMADIYSTAYDFGDFMKSTVARTIQMVEKKRMRKPDSARFAPTYDDKNPHYVEEIFKHFVLPRISTAGGTERIDAEQAAKNMRKLNIFAHCHGAYTALKLEDLTQYKMQLLGYSPKEAAHIQKQMLVVAQSPYCPLGVSKSTMISFASADDDEVSHHNHFQKALQKINRLTPILMSYFPEKQGNLILVKNMGQGFDDHNFWGFEPAPKMSDDAKMLMIMEGNALMEGVKSSYDGRSIPSVENLVAPDERIDLLLQKMKENGKKVYAKILGQTRETFRQVRLEGKKPYTEIELFKKKVANEK